MVAMRRLGMVGAWLLATSCAAGPAATAIVQRCGGLTMGSTWAVEWTGGAAVEVVQHAVETELAAFDATFSRWRDDSEITRWNRRADAAPFVASPLFREVLQQALAVAVITDGAFDPTVQPLSELYRAAKRDPRQALDEGAVRAALERVGHRRTTIVGDTVCAPRADLGLDLDGIVAGACVDAIVRRLDALGVPSFCVDVTGEVFCRGERAPGEPWRIAIGDAARGLPVRTVLLRDRALCTSGVYENAVVAGGRPLHHLFDPRTGDEPDNGVVTATVLADSAALADALDTAFVVLGEDGAARVLASHRELANVGVRLLVVGDDGTLRDIDLGSTR